MTSCAVCGIPATNKCSGCSCVFYCSKEHQKGDWKIHQKACKCYEIKQNPQQGRYVVARRKIKQGEKILSEKPYVLGPKIINSPICLGCHKTLFEPNTSIDFYKCSSCTFPMCGPDCERSAYHVEECKIMKESFCQSRIKNSGDPRQSESSYCVILPLRLILLKKSDPASYKKIMTMESHIEVRQQTKLYSAIKTNLIPFIRDLLQIKEFSEQELMTFAAIFDTNCFEIRVPSQNKKLRGLYRDAMMMNHICVANTKHYFDQEMKINFIALKDIEKGEEITVNYSHPLRTTIERRFQIKLAKCFDCCCGRCKDPTELGTYSSAFNCSKCDGLLISKDSLDNRSGWKCNKCPEEQSAEAVIQRMNALRVTVDSINRRSAEDCEIFLQKWEQIIPSSSVFIIDIKFVLCMIYGNTMEYKNLSDKDLMRKIQLCHDVLEAFEVLEPGCSNSIANVSFELNGAKIVEAQRKVAKGIMNEGDFKTYTQDLYAKVNEAFKILQVGSENIILLNTRLHIITQLVNV